MRKGNFGEITTDQIFIDFELDEFRILHNRVDTIDDPLRQGIDHVFAYRDANGVDRYVIVESKFSLEGTTRTTSSAITDDGRQMSDNWIFGNQRLERAGLSDEDIVALENGAPFDRVLAAADISGNVEFRVIDAEGIAGAPWTP